MLFYFIGSFQAIELMRHLVTKLGSFDSRRVAQYLDKAMMFVALEGDDSKYLKIHQLISSPDPDHRTEGFQGYSK